MEKIGNKWDEILHKEFESDSFKNLENFLEDEYKNYTIYPPREDVFNALKYTPFDKVRVVIIGQDPYYNEGQAHGLCFSVKPDVPAPRSLKNIFKEIKEDLDVDNIFPCLTHWAEQGVLLLNTVLTVRAGSPQSHKNKGWEKLTDAIICALNESKTPIVYLLWGGPARAKKSLITNPNHLILESAHPSPLSAYHGFFGCKHFSTTNEFLIKNGLDPIDWSTYER